MQVHGVVVSGLHMNAVIRVVVMVHHLFVDDQMRKPLRLLTNHKRCGPGQRLPKHDSDEQKGLVGAKHGQSIGGAVGLFGPGYN